MTNKITQMIQDHQPTINDNPACDRSVELEEHKDSKGCACYTLHIISKSTGQSIDKFDFIHDDDEALLRCIGLMLYRICGYHPCVKSPISRTRSILKQWWYNFIRLFRYDNTKYMSMRYDKRTSLRLP